MRDLPLPRLLDHVGADGPSDAEEEKEAKRYRSASTAPRSATGTLPHGYDMVMGNAPVEPHESVRFEEGDDSEFQDVVEKAARSREFLEQPNLGEEKSQDDTFGAGEFHGGYGSASLKECLERIATQEPAALHSGVGFGVGVPHK